MTPESLFCIEYDAVGVDLLCLITLTPFFNVIKNVRSLTPRDSHVPARWYLLDACSHRSLM